jgi:AhpC/TSA family
VWQALHAELEPAGLTVVAVALDEPESAREWLVAAGATFPAVVDRDHVVAERYGLVNIPSVVWIDEEDRVVRPADIAPADDRYRSFTHIDSEVHHRELRAWVRDGVRPLDDEAVRAHQLRPTAAEQLARIERRLGAWLHRAGHAEAAARHFERAGELAPMDWTIRRGTMPLRGGDPFGPEFFAFFQEWEAAGRPSYSLRTGVEPGGEPESEG